MMDLATIRALADEQGRRAAVEKSQPFVPYDGASLERSFARAVPNLGSYRPRGWCLVERLFVDKTGLGGEDEPAMTLAALMRYVREHLDREYGYALVEEGEFQVRVGVFERREERPVHRRARHASAALVLLALGALLAACDGPPAAPARQPQAPVVHPGGGVDVNALLGVAPGTLLNCKVTNGPGSVDPSTCVYTAPGCAQVSNLGPLPWPVTLLVTLGQSGVSLQLSIDEALLRLSLDCYIPSGGTLCQNPLLGVVVPAGGTVAFYSREFLTCETLWNPPLPAGACPISDPAFAFCQ